MRPCAIGDFPPQLAALNQSNVAVQKRVGRGALDGDRETVHQAVKLDPLLAAACSLLELHEMAEELIEVNSEYLPDLG